MNSFSHLCAYASLVLLIVGYACESAVADGPKTVLDYVLEYGDGSNISIPDQPLSSADVERWSQMLDASEAQHRFMMLMFEQFIHRHNEFMDREMPRYLSLTHELTEIWRNEGVSSTNFARKVARVDRANSRMRRQITAIEQSYIESIQPVLTFEQSQRIHVLSNESNRRNCRTFHGHGRWIDVELRPIWNGSASILASPAEHRLVHAIFDDYEDRLTRAVCRYADLQLQRRTQLAENRASRRLGTVRLSESHVRYAEIMSNRLDAARRIRRLNETTLDRVIDVISAESALVFAHASKRAAFPEVYPDATNLREVIARLKDDDSIDEQLRFDLAIILADYRSEYDQIGSELESICIHWGDQMEAGVAGYGRGELLEALKPKLKQRRELAERTLHALAEHPAIADHLREHIDHVPGALRDALHLMPDADTDEE